MDLLLRLLTPRRMAAAMCLLAAGLLIGPHVPRLSRRLYHSLRPETPTPPVPVPPDLRSQLERQDQSRVASSYRRVAARLDDAAAEGFEVSGLKAKAAAALKLSAAGYRWKALEVLGEVEMAIPRKKTRYIPLYPGAEPEAEEVPPDVQPVAAKPRPGAKAKPKAKKAVKRRRR
jgi:hypothetical protein